MNTSQVEAIEIPDAGELLILDEYRNTKGGIR